MIETQIVLAGYGILFALFFPRCYPNHPWGLAALWLVGLGIAMLYSSMLLDGQRRVLGVPVYVWAYLALSAVPAFCLWAGFAVGVFFAVLQPYLAFRIQLWANHR
jgi:hypothetical protein